MVSGIDEKWMNYAISLAKRAWGATSPNPLVGCVIIRNGTVVGRGWHCRAGENHAEINALLDAGEDARSATLYVTLEPCSTTGRTPPCTDAVIRAGISRVVIGALDPNPVHAGQGVALLEQAGISVVHGVAVQRCDELNEAFYRWITTGRPLVLLKMGMTLDGKIALPNGCSQWITGEKARRRVHRLRQWADAIMIGGGTARSDHPSLTARDRKGRVVKSPRRIVVSRTLGQNELETLLPAGVKPELYRVDDSDSWLELMAELGREQVTSILVEGGGELAASMLAAGVVDRVEFHVAPKILGGRQSRPVIGGCAPDKLADALNLDNVSVTMLGNDICIRGNLRNLNTE